MVDYRRNFVPGGTYFFTVNLAVCSERLLIEHVDILRAAFRAVRRDHPFSIDAIAVLPDHLHAVWTLPQGDCDYALRWRLIKTNFSRALASGERRSSSRLSKGERGIWQRRYWEHTIRDERDFERHVDYIHFNPIKHGHVKQAQDWSYSSFQHYVRLGRYPINWAWADEGDKGSFGE